jgi:hypothetical protein
MANGEECKAWGTWGAQCGSVANIKAVQFNGGQYWANDSRCWAKCGNYSVYHEIPVPAGHTCTQAVQDHCASHGGFVDAIWQYCDPS